MVESSIAKKIKTCHCVIIVRSTIGYVDKTTFLLYIYLSQFRGYFLFGGPVTMGSITWREYYTSLLFTLKSLPGGKSNNWFDVFRHLAAGGNFAACACHLGMRNPDGGFHLSYLKKMKLDTNLVIKILSPGIGKDNLTVVLELSPNSPPGFIPGIYTVQLRTTGHMLQAYNLPVEMFEDGVVPPQFLRDYEGTALEVLLNDRRTS